MEEIWKDIKGFNGIYQVSNLGRVKSIDRWIEYKSKNGNLSRKLIKGKIFTDCFDKGGYRSVTFSYNSKNYYFSVHRLVAQTFIPNPDNLPQVNHKDENPSNNCVDTLEWCTAKYNNNYGNHNQKLSNAATGRKSFRTI